MTLGSDIANIGVFICIILGSYYLIKSIFISGSNVEDNVSKLISKFKGSGGENSGGTGPTNGPSGAPGPNPTVDPALVLKNEAGREARNANPILINHKSKIFAWPNPTLKAIKKVQYAWSYVEVDPSSGRELGGLSIIAISPSIVIEGLEITRIINRSGFFNIYCSPTLKNNYITKSNGDQIMDLITIELQIGSPSGTPNPPPASATKWHQIIQDTIDILKEVIKKSGKKYNINDPKGWDALIAELKIIKKDISTDIPKINLLNLDYIITESKKHSTNCITNPTSNAQNIFRANAEKFLTKEALITLQAIDKQIP